MKNKPHLIRLIRENAEAENQASLPGTANDMRQMQQNDLQGQKKTPQSAMNFDIVQIQILNPEIEQYLIKYLEKNKIEFSLKNSIITLQNIPADPIIIQLALNFPSSWIKIIAKEDKNSSPKSIKVKGTLTRAQALLFNANQNNE